MDAQQISECQLCGKKFVPRIGEQFCSPGHAREYFAQAARNRDRRKTDAKPSSSAAALGRTSGHRVMELLKLQAPEEPPPPPASLRLISTGYKPAPIAATKPAGTAAILVEPVAPAQPFVVKLPTAAELAVAEESRQVIHGLQALASQMQAAQPAPQQDPELFLSVFALEFPAFARMASASPTPEAEFQLASQQKPRMQNATEPLQGAMPWADSVAFFRMNPYLGGARIRKTPPAVVPWPPLSCTPPTWQPTSTPDSAAIECNLIFPLEAFSRNKSLWQFAGAPPIDASALETRFFSTIPVLPDHEQELRRFDWAQLIARLADFEPARTDGERTGQHGAAGSTTRRLAVRRKPQIAIPVIGPAIQFWMNQGWAVRGLTIAIPVLAFIAAKPSIDGSLREPVVLAKEMPPPASTVVRREPTRQSKTQPPSAETPAETPTAAAPAVAAAPAAPAVTKSIEEIQKQQELIPPAKRPQLVAESPRKGTKGAATAPLANVEPKLNSFDKMLLDRAAVELADDFSYGLDSWDARSNAVQWTYDPTGFVRPRGLALYRPSMNLSDYSVEFLAKIDASAISWVVRAQDLNNYHVVKLIQRGGGPLPRYTVMRYAVVNGKEGPRIEHPLPLNLYKDTLFRIRMDIRGSNYAVLVQDSVVDSWSDDRFPTGGVGFFSGLGEDGRIRWVQVTYQNDFLGKLCAWLAPKTS